MMNSNKTITVSDCLDFIKKEDLRLIHEAAWIERCQQLHAHSKARNEELEESMSTNFGIRVGLRSVQDFIVENMRKGVSSDAAR